MKIMGKFEKLLSLTSKKKIVSLQSLAFIVIALSILLYLVLRNKEVILENKWEFRIEFLVAAFLLYGLSLFIGAYIWGELLKKLGINIGFKENFRHYCINMLARRIPGSIWYVVYRTQVYSRYGVSASLPTLASGIEMVIAIISAILVFFVFSFQVLEQYVSGPWLLIGIILVGLSILNPKVLRWIFLKFGHNIELLNIMNLVIWTILYFVMWVLSGTIMFFTINTLTDLPWKYLSLVIGGWAFIGATSYLLLFLPTNLGFSEVSLSLLLSSVIPSSIAVVVTLFSRICLLVFEILWVSLALLILKIFSDPNKLNPA